VVILIFYFQVLLNLAVSVFKSKKKVGAMPGFAEISGIRLGFNALIIVSKP